MHIDWDELTATAVAAMKRAYAPYSNYPVGAAGIGADGVIYSGCNVENASYPVGLCAECGMISDLVKAGGGRLVAMIAVNGNEEPVVPCGRCRQLVYEHGGDNLLVKIPAGVLAMREVMPFGFGTIEMGEVKGATTVPREPGFFDDRPGV